MEPGIQQEAFAALFGDSPYIAFIMDASGLLLASNERARAYCREAGQTENAYRLYLPWAACELRDEALPQARKHGVWRGELVLRGIAGREWAASHTVDFQPGSDGEGDSYRVSLHELREYDSYGSRLRFKRLFEQHPHPAWVFDVETLRFLVVNKAMIDTYGYSEEELLGMTIRDIRPASEHSRLAQSLRDTPPDAPDFSRYWTHRRKDGTLLSVEVSSHPLVLAGRNARFVIAHDVTETLGTERALHASEEMNRLVIDHIPHQIFWKGLDLRYQGCNDVFARAAGLRTREEVVGKTDRDFPWAHNAERIRAEDNDILRTGRPLLNREDHLPFADGTQHWFLINKLPLHGVAGETIGLLGTIEDVTERKQVEHVLRMHDRALDASASAIAITAVGGDSDAIEYANAAFYQLCGYGREEVQGRSLERLLATEGDGHAAALHEAMRAQSEITLMVRAPHRDGSLYWARLHVAPVRGEYGEISHRVCVLTDMTSTMDYQSQLEHQASHDALTGLPNRNLCSDRLAQAIGYAQRYGHTVWVVFLDLDNFKLVNDNLGHAAGDELLCTIAGRLRGALRETDTVARLGGDEFVLVLLTGAQAAPSQAMLQEILATVSEPVRLAGREVAVSCSMGVSLYPTDGTDAQLLMRHADIAMYRAKEAGRNQVQFYEAAMHARVVERAEIESELRGALARGEFFLQYQPKARVDNGEITGVEALIRWRHPRLGLVSPARFIGVAEETGLIVAIGRWVIQTACAQCKAWLDADLPPVRVAVNVSARQFRDKSLLEDVVSALQATRLEPASLELELTESMMMHDADASVAMVERLKKVGVALSIDDFGTGYSSLAYLKLFPIDYLKIDQSFVREMLGAPAVAAIVRSVIALGHSLDFRVVAEGVETDAQLAYLRRYNCDEAQGYHLSRPLDPEALAELLAQGAAQAELPPAAAPNGTLLLLDDEPNIVSALVRLLRRDGYRILTANTAEEAFALLAINDVQVVISDQRMPAMNGTDFLSRVKKLYPGTVRIILSGYTELDTVLNAINRGEIYRFYTKPWDEQTLRENVREAFRYHALIRGTASEPA
jgi:diguanylate cyclase (GGDEF)-like protein/PAS domain S-box-containing protein